MSLSSPIDCLDLEISTTHCNILINIEIDSSNGKGQERSTVKRDHKKSSKNTSDNNN